MLSMKDALQAVSAFHERQKVSSPEDPTVWKHDEELASIGRELIEISKRLTEKLGERRWLRSHLECEELGEKIIAMAEGDVIEAFDGSVDQLYVLLGTAVTFGLPLSEGFMEVHRSNMTKEKQPDDPHAERLRSKGPNYSPPRMKALYWLLRRKRGACDRATAAAALGVAESQLKQAEYEMAYGGDPLEALNRERATCRV